MVLSPEGARRSHDLAVRPLPTARAAISGRTTARGKRMAANSAGNNHGCNFLSRRSTALPPRALAGVVGVGRAVFARSGRPSIALAAQLLDQGIEFVLDDTDGAGADFD
jgi:hypothetical protein